MAKYIIHGQSFKGDVTLEYDFDGRLKMMLFDCEMSERDHLQFVRNMDINEANFLERAKRGRAVYDVIPNDLSFEKFWNTYNYKVGNKLRAEKLWDKMKETERVSVLKAIPKYNWYLNQKNIDKAYPETWLSQKRFLTNEY